MSHSVNKHFKSELRALSCNLSLTFTFLKETTDAHEKLPLVKLRQYQERPQDGDSGI